MNHIISPALSPNAEAEDVREAWRTLLSPGLWQEGDAITLVESWFRTHFEVDTAVSFNSGRSALLALLHAFGIGRGDSVLVQAFTCVAVPNSVVWAGARPVYVDIDDTLNIDIADAERKIAERTKAIIVQHTFGTPADMDRAVALAKKHNLILIEDCAHSLGGTYKGKKLGTIGDAAFFSFGRDKVLSSVWGGIASLNVKRRMVHVEYKLKKFKEELPYPSRAWIAQQLFHPVAFAAILPTYTIVLGKVLLETLKRLGFLSVPVYEEEKRGGQPSVMPRQYPNALARLLLRQLSKLERYTTQRQGIAALYRKKLRSKEGLSMPPYIEGSCYLRYPVFVDKPENVVRRLQRHGILLGNWYHNVIDPKGVDFVSVGYTLGSCPKAEQAARSILNIPTRITRREAERIVSLL